MSYVMVLFTIAVLGTVSLSFALMTGLQRDVASNYGNNAQAHYLARAGLNVGIWRMLNEPGFVDTYDGQLISYAFQSMSVEYMVEKADNNDSLLITSTASVANASSTLRHLIIPSVEDAAESTCIVAYGEGTQQAPRYRTWDGAAWSDEAMADSVGGTIRWAVLKSCPVRNEKILGTLDTSGHVNVQVWNGSAWGPATELTTAITTQRTQARGFDIAYESDSGDAVVVYSDNQADPLYRIWNGSAWSAPAVLDVPTGDTILWVRLEPNPNSDEIVVATSDNGTDGAAAVWDGDSWGNAIVLETALGEKFRECIAMAYEGISTRAMVGWTEGSLGAVQYRFWDGGSWSSEADSPTMSNWTLYWLRLRSDSSSNRIVMAASDWWWDLNVNIWDGSSWGTNLEVETTLETISSRCFDVGFESSGDQAIVAWSDSKDHSVDYRVWTSGTWSSEQNGPDVGNDIKILQLVADSDSDEIFMTTNTDDSDLQTTLWDGSNWGSPDEIETDSSGGLDYESFMLAY